MAACGPEHVRHAAHVHGACDSAGFRTCVGPSETRGYSAGDLPAETAESDAGRWGKVTCRGFCHSVRGLRPVMPSDEGRLSGGRTVHKVVWSMKQKTSKNGVEFEW